MKSLVRALWVWLVLCGLSWSLAMGGGGDLTDPTAAGVLLVLFSAAIWLTVIAAASDAPVSYGRTLVLTFTAVVWVATLLLVQGRIDSHPKEKQTVLAAVGLAALLAVGVVVKTRLYPRWSTLRGMAITLAIPAVAGGIFLWRYEAKTTSFVTRAEARWNQIGMPLEEFEKTLVASHENGGSKVFRKVLREETGNPFYKFSTLATTKEPPIQNTQNADLLVKQAVDLLVNNQPSDDLDFSAQRTDTLEAMVPMLDTNYRHILAEASPTWNLDPHDGYNLDMPTLELQDLGDINAPNFLGIRKFAQVTAGDALQRFSLGDQEGAARALSAGLHITGGLRQHPTILSLMIGVAVEALFSGEQARLPASSEDRFPAIARDTEEYRTQFLRSLQFEAWTALHFTNQIAELRMRFQPKWALLPKWARLITARREAAIVAFNEAERAAILKAPETVSLPDFGESLQEAISKANPCAFDRNVARAIMRIHATMLLREQTELIRDARARLASGQPLEGRDSVVLPHVRWELTTDAEKSSVSTHLVGAPEWIVNGEVAPTAFWLIPLDGSAAWKFHRPTPTTKQ